MGNTLQEGVVHTKRFVALIQQVVFAGGMALMPLPLLAEANWATVFNFLRGISDAINALFPFLFALILLVFLWGLVKFVWGASSDAQAKGKSFMVWGVVALFVASTIWGLVALLTSLLGVSTEGGVAANPSIEVYSPSYGPRRR